MSAQAAYNDFDFLQGLCDGLVIVTNADHVPDQIRGCYTAPDRHSFELLSISTKMDLTDYSVSIQF